jgi:heme-degrading monooxygenase HmoA
MTLVANWLVVLRFSVPTGTEAGFAAEATTSARLLASADGCLGVEVGRASDERSVWVLSSRWRSVGDYRRAVSSYEVKAAAVPFLSTAVDEPSAFEVLFAVDAQGERAASGDLASDAESVDRSR